MRSFVVAAAVALLVPATAAAQDQTPILTGTGGTVKGYKISFVGLPSGAELDLVKTTHGETESHALSNFGSPPTSYTAAADLSSATIDGGWGPMGNVSLTFTATGPEKKQLPANCTGKASPTRTGTLTGTITAKFDKKFFKTIKVTSMKGALTQGGSFFCGAAGGGGFGGPDITSLGITAPFGKMGGSFARLGKKETLENVSVTTEGSTGIWELIHRIQATTSASAFSTTSRGAATVKAKGPLLSGKVTFKPGNPARIGGNFKAKFDSIGTQRFSAKVMATLASS